MLKRSFLSVFLVVILIISTSVIAYAEGDVPKSIEAPQDPSLRLEHESTIDFRWTNPASVLKILDDLSNAEYYGQLYYLIDWKLNDGAWNVALERSDPNFDDNLNGQFTSDMGSSMLDDDGVSETFFVTWHLDPSPDAATAYDLQNNTYYFRIRYYLESYDEEFEPVYSSYSKVEAIGKDAAKTVITKLDAPQNLKVEVIKDSNNKPYFQLNWIIPETITETNKKMPVYHIIDFKVGDGKWLSETTEWDALPQAPSSLLMFSDTLDPIEEDFVDKVVIEENIYYFRLAYVCEQLSGAPIISTYSNVASTKMVAYTNASEWAKTELDEADQKGLIPDSLKGKDMTLPITREEFAELAVKLYEKTTGEAVVPAANPFTDTTNPEILKAKEVGITEGVSTTKFAPNDLTNREQVATMLSRTIRKMVPTGDFATTGAPKFSDEDKISSWALEHVLYMAKQGIIKGTDGRFEPKAVTTKETASGYATTTREQAVAMSLRTYNSIK